jgi:septal ring-binding cell division protein DamX
MNLNLTKKQQVLSVATLFVFLMIVWQVYHMVSTPSEPKMPPAAGIAANGMPMQPMSGPIKAGRAEKMSKTSESGVSQLEQEAYLRLASEYQLIQMQRMIAEGYAAIAAARLNAAKALSELNKYNVDVGAGTLPSMSGEGKGEYELIYLGQQAGEWAATLKKGSQTFDVITGTVLGKGARVVQIDNEGVVVIRNNKKILVTFNGDVPVTEEDVEQESVAAAEAQELTEIKKAKVPEKVIPAPLPVPVQQAVLEKSKAMIAEQKQTQAKIEQEVQAKKAVVETKLVAVAPAPIPAPQPVAKKPEIVAPKPVAPVPAPAPIRVAEIKKLVVDVKPAPVPVAEVIAKKPEVVAPKPVAPAPVAKLQNTQNEVRIPPVLKPLPRVPTIEIALMKPENKKADTAKTQPAVASAVIKPVPAAAPVIPAKPVLPPAPDMMAKPAATMPMKPVMAPAPNANKPAVAQTTMTTTTTATKSTPKPTAAEQADFQQLQALLPPDQAKKISGNGKPAAITPPVPAAVTKQESTPIEKLEFTKPQVKKEEQLAPVVKPEAAQPAKAVDVKPTLALATTTTTTTTSVIKQAKASEEKPEQSAPVAEPKKMTSSSAYPSSEARLLGASPSSYTIQMIANTEPSSLLKFIKTYHLGEKAMWYRTTLKGSPWCVLIYGEYPDAASASKALAALPANTRAWTPFVRKMASVQAAIQQGPAKDTVPQKSNQAVPEVTKPVASEKMVPALKIEKPVPVIEKKPEMMVEKPAPVVEKKSEMMIEKPTPVVATYPSGEKRLLAAKQTAYTIQLTSNADLDVIFKVIKDNQLDKRAMWYRSTRDGKDLYVLVYGDFTDMTEARKAFAELPDAVRTSTPFIRQMSSIQAAIKR